jgi:hypothetical protein
MMSLYGWSFLASRTCPVSTKPRIGATPAMAAIEGVHSSGSIAATLKDTASAGS